MSKIGIIGGSGLDKPDILTGAGSTDTDTPFGPPSGPILTGTIAGTEIAILGRHGPEHTIPPSEVNYRANIVALQSLGVDMIIATTAVGSLREEIDRGHFVILDQFIDFTRRRMNTFQTEFEPGNAVHTSMAEPFDPRLRAVLLRTAQELGLTVHPKGTVVTIEGPRFSTRAESHMFRAWGADVINMSIATECALANEAGIPYAAVAMSTDYDCWRTGEEPVSWEQILQVCGENAQHMTDLLVTAVPALADIGS